MIKTWRVKLHTWDQKPSNYTERLNDSEDFMDYDDNEENFNDNVLIIQENNEYIFWNTENITILSFKYLLF